jgi:hypothetical protein
MQTSGCAPRLRAEGLIESNIKPVFLGAVKERSLWNYDLEHLLQAQCLGANLDLVAAIALRPPALVLDRKRHPKARGSRQPDSAFADSVELDDISFPRQAEPQGPQQQPACDPNIAPRFGARPGFVDAIVQVLPLDRERIVRPQSLDMDQGTLPFAEQQVLQGRKLQQLIFLIHELLSKH